MCPRVCTHTACWPPATLSSSALSLTSPLLSDQTLSERHHNPHKCEVQGKPSIAPVIMYPSFLSLLLMDYSTKYLAVIERFIPYNEAIFMEYIATETPCGMLLWLPSFTNGQKTVTINVLFIQQTKPTMLFFTFFYIQRPQLKTMVHIFLTDATGIYLLLYFHDSLLSITGSLVIIMC